MRYMFLVTQTKGGQPPQALIDAMEEARKKAGADGGMISTGGLAPPEQGTRATLKGGRLTVTDGPFAEAKELVGGYAIMEHPTREAAVEAGRHWAKDVAIRVGVVGHVRRAGQGVLRLPAVLRR